MHVSVARGLEGPARSDLRPPVCSGSSVRRSWGSSRSSSGRWSRSTRRPSRTGSTRTGPSLQHKRRAFIWDGEKRTHEHTLRQRKCFGLPRSLQPNQVPIAKGSSSEQFRRARVAPSNGPQKVMSSKMYTSGCSRSEPCHLSLETKIGQRQVLQPRQTTQTTTISLPTEHCTPQATRRREGTSIQHNKNPEEPHARNVRRTCFL